MNTKSLKLTFFFSISVVFFVIAIHQIVIVGLGKSYIFIMLSVISFLSYVYAKGYDKMKVEEKAKVEKIEIPKKRKR